MTNNARCQVTSIIRVGLVVLSLCLGWTQMTHADLRVAVDTPLTAAWSDNLTMSGNFRPEELYDCGGAATGKADLRLMDRQAGREVSLLGVDFGMNPFPIVAIGTALDVRVDEVAVKWVDESGGHRGDACR